MSPAAGRGSVFHFELPFSSQTVDDQEQTATERNN